MATIKSFSDLEQSRKLAEILPLESADMCWQYQKDRWAGEPDYEEFPQFEHATDKRDIPCWSLASLLGVVKTYSSRLEIILRADKNYNIFAVYGDFVFRSFDDFPDGFDTLVDACYEMILKLNELDLL